MLKVIVRRITEGRSETFYGDETRVRARLHREFPECVAYHDLDDVVRAINDYGQAEVEVAPYQPTPEARSAAGARSAASALPTERNTPWKTP